METGADPGALSSSKANNAETPPSSQSDNAPQEPATKGSLNPDVARLIEKTKTMPTAESGKSPLNEDVKKVLDKMKEPKPAPAGNEFLPPAAELADTFTIMDQIKELEQQRSANPSKATEINAQLAQLRVKYNKTLLTPQLYKDEEPIDLSKLLKEAYSSPRPKDRGFNEHNELAMEVNETQAKIDATNDPLQRRELSRDLASAKGEKEYWTAKLNTSNPPTKPALVRQAGPPTTNEQTAKPRQELPPLKPTAPAPKAEPIRTQQTEVVSTETSKQQRHPLEQELDTKLQRYNLALGPVERYATGELKITILKDGKSLSGDELKRLKPEWFKEDAYQPTNATLLSRLTRPLIELQHAELKAQQEDPDAKMTFEPVVEPPTPPSRLARLVAASKTAAASLFKRFSKEGKAVSGEQSKQIREQFDTTEQESSGKLTESKAIREERTAAVFTETPSLPPELQASAINGDTEPIRVEADWRKNVAKEMADYLEKIMLPKIKEHDQEISRVLPALKADIAKAEADRAYTRRILEFKGSR